MASLTVTQSIAIDESELSYRFVRSSGPGGQNVNKVATAVQLCFNVAGSASLPIHVRDRMLSLYKNRISTDGILTIDARQYRTQERNRAEAIERLMAFIIEAARLPKKRIHTKPSRTAKRKRVENKRHRGEIKKMRTKPKTGDFT